MRGPRFYACRLDEDLIGEAVRVARLRAYDAAYVALAVALGEPLFTLDGASFPGLRVVGVS